MNLTSTKVIKNLLTEYNLRPAEELGQNFLIDKYALKKIVEAADLKAGDIVLEIGPGLGTLTQELAQRVWRVIVVEKDAGLFEILQENLKNFSNIKFIRDDILEVNLALDYRIMLFNYKIVANLPYSIVAPVIRKFLEEPENRPNEMTLLVQKEVAQRICSKPPDMNLLALSCQFYGSPKTIDYIPKESFWPQPKVDGAILKISEINSEFYQTRRIEVNPELFFKIIKAAFSQPRKQLINNLPQGLQITDAALKNWLLKNDILPSQRAETLNMEDWIKLTKNFGDLS